jgi:hypothetical protein
MTEEERDFSWAEWGSGYGRRWQTKIGYRVELDLLRPGWSTVGF